MNDDLPGYFMEQTNSRLVRIEDKLDTILAFKWQVIAGATVVSGFLAIAIQVAAIYFAR